jgi:hypothetical protein
MYSIRNSLHAVLLLAFVRGVALPQRNVPLMYQNQALGIEIRCDSSEFDPNKSIKVSTNQWEESTIAHAHLKIKIPPGFVITYEQRRFFNFITPSIDSSLFGFALVVIPEGAELQSGLQVAELYFTGSSFEQIAWAESFETRDSSYTIAAPRYTEVLWLRDLHTHDSSAIAWAVAHNYWFLTGWTEGEPRASYLNGHIWKGLRVCHKLSAGEQFISEVERSYRAFLARQLFDGCTVVCSYGDIRPDSRGIGESDFYDMISTIQIDKDRH